MSMFSKRRGRIKQKWKHDTKSTLLTGPMVYDVNGNGRKEIVFGTKDGRIVLMDENSQILWTYDVTEEVGAVESYFQNPEGANGVTTTPSIADIDNDHKNEVIFGTEDGYIYCLYDNGNIAWKFKADDAVRSKVLLKDINNDGLIEAIFGDMRGNLYVVSARGEELWKYEAGSAIEGTPEIIEEYNRFVFGCHDGTVRCVNYGKKEIWKYKTKGKVLAKPVIEDLYGNESRVIIIGSSDYTLYALNENGGLIWSYDTEGAILSEVAVDDINGDGKKEVVFGSCDNKVYALTHEGDKIWNYETYFWVVAPPIIADIDNDGKKEVVIGSYDNNIYILDSEGDYSLDFVPGLGGVIHQAGHYTSFMTKEPGKVMAEKIWQYNAKGFVVGCALNNREIIVNVKEGFVMDLAHEK